jgi:hypothetical protein
MASYSEIERWLSVLATGMAGLRLLKHYGVRSPELEHFIQNITDGQMSISAFAPSPLREQYQPLISQTEEELKSETKKLSDPNVSEEIVDSVLNKAQELYTLLSDMHRNAFSSLIIV